jgi:hypothetical protein
LRRRPHGGAGTERRARRTIGIRTPTERYGEHFAARVWIHEADRAAAPTADDILTGREPVAIDADLTAVTVPGHTEDSVVYLHDQRCLFTGDSLAWNFETDDLEALRECCRWSWSNYDRSSDYSTAGSNGCLPDMVEAGIFPPARCTRGSRRCLNGWQELKRAARSVICYSLRVSLRSSRSDG